MSTVTPIRKPSAKATVGSVTDAMCDLREQRRVLADQDKALKAQYDELEVQLLSLLDSQDTRRCEGHKASASITESVQANVTDWETFWKYVFKNKYSHLLQKRVSVEACRELFETKGSIPGVEPFTKRTINLRNL